MTFIVHLADAHACRFPLRGKLDAAGGFVLGDQRLEVLACRVCFAGLIFPAGEAKSGFRQAAPVRDYWISCGIGRIKDKSIREVTFFRAARVIADLITEDNGIFRGFQEFGIALITVENRQISFPESLPIAPCRDTGAALQRNADGASCCRCFRNGNAGTFMQINTAAAFCGATTDGDRVSTVNPET